MKNLIFIFLLIIFTGSSVKAQEFVLFGAKGGVNFANMSSKKFIENKTRTGYYLGLLSEFPLGKRFSLQPEVLYSIQGTKAKETSFGGTSEYEYKMDYIQVPVLAKIYLAESISIEGGPSFNFLVNEKIGGLEREKGSSFEFAGALGASYKFRAGFFSARYIYGFTAALGKGDDWQSIYNRGLQLGVGFMF